MTRLTEYEQTLQNVRDVSELCGPEHKDGFVECMTANLYGKITDIQTSLSSLRQDQSKLANKLRNYTCADASLQTTPAIRIETMQLGELALSVHVHLDTSHAKIFSVPSFISEEECAVLKAHGKPRLARATVAAQDGTSVVSEHRKAQQASYDLHQERGQADPLW